MPSVSIMRIYRFFCIFVILLLAGCASRPINEPITQIDPKGGYRPHLLITKIPNNDPHTLFVLSFSGGGTRAAAFSYGVLEELRRTEILVEGRQRRLIDEVDVIIEPTLTELLDDSLWQQRLFYGRDLWFYEFPEGTLWGATAFMVRELLDYLR